MRKLQTYNSNQWIQIKDIEDIEEGEKNPSQTENLSSRISGRYL